MSELAVDGVPVRFRVGLLILARQLFYRWLSQRAADVWWDKALIANAVVNAHRDEPEFGYRFVADEVRDARIAVSD